MSINHGTWPKVSQWNSFRYINLSDSFYIFQVCITTQSLTLQDLPLDREKQLWTIKGLFDNGMSANQIAAHLNDKGLLTPCGKQYYSELVWVTNNKFNKLLRRRQNVTSTISNLFIVTTVYGEKND